MSNNLESLGIRRIPGVELFGPPSHDVTGGGKKKKTTRKSYVGRKRSAKIPGF